MGAVRRLVDELRRRGLTVHEWSGWDVRGNAGITHIDPRGGIVHHTASNYGSAYPELVSSSQPWANKGALCNFAGNADGSLTVIASGLTYHAGKGAGPSLGPLTAYRYNLNYFTVGLEIVYPGVTPMTTAQYRTAQVWSKTVADLFGGGNIECVRAHAETNGIAPGGDRKWDPGQAEGKTINMAAFRAGAARLLDGIFDMTPEELEEVLVRALQRVLHARYGDGRNIVDDLKQQTASAMESVDVQKQILSK